MVMLRNNFSFLFLYSLSAVSAFAPHKVVPKTTALQQTYENEIGAQPPVGFFDPLGLSKHIDEDTFEYYREAEVKHGRICQLAIIGYIVPEIFRFPGELVPGLKFSDIPNGIAAVQVVPVSIWLIMAILIGYIDMKLSVGQAALPFTFNVGRKTFETPLLKDEAEAQEIAHGRLAMLAILELLRHDAQNFVSGTAFDGMDHLITGLPFLYH